MSVDFHLRIPQKLAELIDKEVENGDFRGRSDFICYILRLHFREQGEKLK